MFDDAYEKNPQPTLLVVDNLGLYLQCRAYATVFLRPSVVVVVCNVMYCG